jgi:hypothetical protein
MMSANESGGLHNSKPIGTVTKKNEALTAENGKGETENT